MDNERKILTMEERVTRRGRRIGRWQYVEDRWMGDRWRLDGTTIDLEYDSLDRNGCALKGAWRVFVGDAMHEPIDHFLTGYCGAMWWVEQVIVGTVTPVDGVPAWALHARAELAQGSAA